ncbi:unnamed protein product [Dovyalis caffra]|uniref:Uncharacterized protein n=1 Tax=Dovyalis caffra TaxID=77055 RepID=A0AAV1RH85_9ROSI|nr:unnamed protein product [Dovyalis caffra]
MSAEKHVIAPLVSKTETKNKCQSKPDRELQSSYLEKECLSLFSFYYQFKFVPERLPKYASTYCGSLIVAKEEEKKEEPIKEFDEDLGFNLFD